MYHNYFGLTEPAFSIAVNPKYLYMSSQHKEALAHLLYGVKGGGFVLLSGEVGTGKTTIIRCLLEQLPENTEIAFVLNPMASVEEVLATICEELHVDLLTDAKPQAKTMMDALQAHLLKNYAQGKRTVLLIDEAQLLSASVLEQIRLLTNLETSTEKLLQIVLVGQPEINELLAQPRLRQLSQRITARFHLNPLNIAETFAYIDHRLKIAGLKDIRPIFPIHIIRKIHRFSGGIPRLINILCERLLVGAYGYNRHEIDNQIYKLAITEVAATRASHSISSLQAKPLKYILAALICAFVISGFAIFLFMNSSNNEVQQAHSVATPPHSQALSHTISNISVDKDTSEPSPNSLSTTFVDSATGFARLFKYYQVQLESQNHPCWQTDLHRLSCTMTNLESWQELKEINRPIILSLVTEDKNRVFVVLVGADEKYASLLGPNLNTVTINRSELGRLWTGAVTYLWKQPKGFEKALSVGSRSQVVTWVAEQFALLDGQTSPITTTRFIAPLKARIQIFQASHGLEEDGIIGERTLMKLNEQIGVAKTLRHPTLNNPQ